MRSAKKYFSELQIFVIVDVDGFEAGQFETDHLRFVHLALANFGGRHEHKGSAVEICWLKILRANVARAGVACRERAVWGHSKCPLYRNGETPNCHHRARPSLLTEDFFGAD